MAGTPGKKGRVKVSTTSGGTYNVVGGVQTAQHSIDGTNVDVSELGGDYIERVQGLKDGKLSLSGNLRTSDANGQAVIRSAFLNDTPLFVQVLPDGGTTATLGFQQEMKVSSWKIGAEQAGKISWSCELEGSGAITPV